MLHPCTSFIDSMHSILRRAATFGSVKLRKLLRPAWGETEYVAHFGRASLARDGEGFRLIRYDLDGSLDFDAYRRVQIAVNKAKLGTTFAVKANIRALRQHVGDAVGDAGAILCHGTRNGAEQRYFAGAFPRASVLGTEISDTATQFPDTIQWDFHDVKPEWLGAWDIVYSNSWDHTYDPEKMLAAWISCLKPGGALVLEHSRSHRPEGCCAADPFGATVEGLIQILSAAGQGKLGLAQVVGNLPDPALDRCFIIARAV